MAQRPNIKIECRNVSKSFVTEQYTINVLDDISLQVEENEFLVVLGPGQSGKTTLLNCMAGIIMPDAGQILLDGKTITGPGPDRGVVFQQYALFPWKTVMDNVSFGLYIKGVEKVQAQRSRPEVHRPRRPAGIRDVLPAPTLRAA